MYTRKKGKLAVIHPMDANVVTCEHWLCRPSKLYSIINGVVPNETLTTLDFCFCQVYISIFIFILCFFLIQIRLTFGQWLC